MEVNNLEIIKNILTFDSPDDFYHLQIIKRKKENPELGSNSYIVKTYYISSIEHLEKHFDEIVSICNFHKARAGINLNKRSFEKVGFNTLKKITDQIMNKDFKSIRNAYNSVCGNCSNAGKEKKWIIDVDSLDMNVLNETYEKFPKENIITTLPTRNGYHIITKPFNLQQFNVGHDIHKDNPTILYLNF